MASKILITGSKYFNQLKNDSDFTEATGDFTDWLAANVGSKMRFETNISISTQMLMQRYEITGGNTINIISGNSFFKEDFYAGGTAVLTFQNKSPFSYQFDIESISSDGLTLIATNIIEFGGGAAPLPNGSYGNGEQQDYLRDISASEGCYMKFNLIGNEDQTNYISSIDQVEQVFKFDNLGALAPVNGIWGNTVLGSKTGEAILEFLGAINDNGVNVDNNGSPITGQDPAPTIQQFTLRHDFILQPSYLQGEIENIADQIRPDRLNGSDLRHVIEFDFRSSLSNPNNSKIAQYDNVLGTTNYFGEVYIDQENSYSIDNVSLIDANTLEAVDGIVVNEVTRVSFSVLDSGNAFVIGDPVVVGHQAAFTADKYAESQVDFITTNLYDSLRNGIDDAAVGTGIIQNFTATFINSGQIDVQFDLVYTSSEQGRVDTGDNYFLWIEVADNTLTTAFSNKSPLTVDTGEYQANTDVPGLFETTMQFVDHIKNEFDDYIGTIEDLIVVKGQIKTDYTLEANIDNISIQLIGVDPLNIDDFFEITRVQIPFESFIIDGKQIIVLDTTRGFNLPEEGGIETFNYFKLNWVSNDGQFSYYDYEIGYHLSWQDWEALNGVPDAFFDQTKENNGQNKNSSNYSNKQGYETSISLLANMSQRSVEGLQTLYHTISPRITIYNKEENVINI
jgi:hypothetical protein